MLLHRRELGTGDGVPVVCLHGVQGDGTRFRRLAAAALAGRAVVAFDLRGHADSGWEPPWNLETFLDDVRESLDHQSIDLCDLVGFSFGGRLGLELAASDAHRIRRLVLLDPAIHIPPAAAADFADGVRNDVGFADLDAAVDARMSALAHAPRELVADDLADAFVTDGGGRLHYRLSRSAVVAAYGEMARPPSVPTDPRPTLLVRAADGLVHDEHETMLRAALGEDLTVEDVPGSHSVLWDAFAQTAAAVEAHLNR